MSQDTFYDKSTLTQVKTWCRQATTHYLRFMSPYDVARPQLVDHIVSFR